MVTKAVGLAAKFQALAAEVRGLFIGRDAEVDLAVCALVAKQHCCFIGPPGVAKSAVIGQVAKRFTGSRYFRKSVYGDTPEADLYGMCSLRGLDVDDVYRHNVEGFLPTADIGNLEEMFQASGSLLPALHDNLFERIYRNGPDELRLPLITMFCSTNFVPKDRLLEALWDRLLFRRHVAPLHDRSQRKAMLRLNVPAEPTATVSIEELRTAIAAANEVAVPDFCVERYLDVIGAVSEQGVRLTDRRQCEAISAVRSHAWLHDRLAATSDDLQVLRHVLWTRPEEISIVAEVLKDVCASVAEAAGAVAEDLALVGRDVETASAADQFSALTQGIEKCQQAGATVKALDKRSATPDDAAAIKRATALIIKFSQEWPARLKSASANVKAKR